MADQRIEDITGGELTAPNPDDLFVVLDESDTTDDSDGTAKYIKYGSLKKADLPFDSTLRQASFTATVGMLSKVSILSADVKVTFPSSPSAGDRIGILVTSESSSSGNYTTAPGYGVEPVTGTKIAAVDYTQSSANEGTGSYGLWQTGEYLEFVYIDSTTGWCVISDGRKPMTYYDNINATQSIANTAASTMTKIGLNASYGSGGLASAADDDLEIKRAGVYMSAFHSHVTLGASSTSLENRIVKGSTAEAFAKANSQYGSGDFSVNCVYTDELSAHPSTDTISFQHQHTNSGTAAMKFSVTFEEVLNG